MSENPVSKSELKDMALNDVENCVRELFTNPNPESAWEELNLSLRAASGRGVSPESLLSKLLNSIPDASARDRVIAYVAKRHDLTDSEIEEILAPED